MSCRYSVTESVIAKEVTGMRVGISHKQSTGIFDNIRDFVVCSRMSSWSDAFSDMQRHSLGCACTFLRGKVEGG